MFDEALVCCQSHWGKGTSLHIRTQRGPMGQPWRRVRGGSVPCPQLWPVVHVRCSHSFISLSERESHLLVELQIQGCPVGSLDSLSPTPYLIYTMEHLLWTILHFLSFYYWQCKCKCEWSPLWFPPDLKNRNEGQLLKILEFQRDLITAGRGVRIWRTWHVSTSSPPGRAKAMRQRLCPLYRDLGVNRVENSSICLCRFLSDEQG